MNEGRQKARDTQGENGGEEPRRERREAVCVCVARPCEAEDVDVNPRET